MVREFLSDLCGDLEWKFRLSEMTSSSVIFGVKQFEKDNELDDVGERATVFRNVGDYLRVDRISQAPRIRAPFSYMQLIRFNTRAAQTVCYMKWNYVMRVYQHCLACYKVLLNSELQLQF
jgi:hypothetical protein